MRRPFFHFVGCNKENEYQQNIGMFIKRLKAMEPLERQLHINGIVPTNIQDSLSHVKILLIFKQYHMLKYILYSSNWILAKVIIKNKDFLNHIVSCKDLFIKDICPSISYNCRIGILRNLGKLILHGLDELYHQVYNTYGKLEANLILTACSYSLIKKKYESFTDREMIKLYKRFGFKIMIWYYELSNDFKPGNAVIDFLVREQDGAALICLSKYEMKLGKKGIILMLRADEFEFIKKPKKYQQWKHLIYKYLNENDWFLYFKNLFPKYKKDFSSCDDIYNNLLMLPIQYRFEVLCNGYHEKYVDEIDITEGSKLLLALPASIRLGFIVRNDPMLGDSYVVTSTTLCNINANTNVDYRISMYRVGILNCKINNNTASLLLILNHISTIGKNYSFPIREAVLVALREHFKLLDLSEEHWDCVKIIIQVFKDKKETFFDRVYFTEVDLIKSVRAGNYDYTLLHKYLMEGGCFRLWSLDKVSPKLQIDIARMIGYLIDTEYMDQPYLVIEFLSFIEDHNRKHRKTRMCYYYYYNCLKVLFEQFGKQNNFYYTYIVESVLCYQPKSFVQETLQKRLWKHYMKINNPEKYNGKVIINILKHCPRLIIEYSNKIKNNKFEDQKFFYQCAKMVYTKVDRYLDRMCLSCFNPEFKKEIEEYLVESVEEDDTNQREFYRSLYFYSLSRTPVPYFYLALRYVKKDFSNDVPAVIQDLLKKVPIKTINTEIIPIYYSAPLIDLKTARYIIEVNTNCEYYQRIKTAMNLFKRDPSEEFMEVLVKIIKPESPRELCKILHRFHKIPKDKLVQYVEFLWKDKDRQSNDIANYLTIPKLMRLKNNTIMKLFKELLKMLPNQTNVSFFCGYIKEYKDFSFFFHAMQTSKWDTIDCTDFMLLMCHELLQYEDTEDTGNLIFDLLYKIDIDVLPMKIMFQYRIFFQLLKSYVLHAFGEFIKDKQAEVFEYFSDFTNIRVDYGYEALNCLSKYISAFLSLLPNSTEIRIALAQVIIEESEKEAEAIKRNEIRPVVLYPKAMTYLAICLLPWDAYKLGFAKEIKSFITFVMKSDCPKIRNLIKNFKNTCKRS